MDWLKLVHGTSERASRGTFRPGDEVRVWYRIIEQGKERLGQFEGLVIRVRGSGPSKTFTVRRVTHGEGVERVFPFDSKIITKIDVLRHGEVKRSRLYFLRAAVGKTRLTSTEAQSGDATELPPAAGQPLKTGAAVEKSEGAVAATNPADRANPTG